MSKFVHVDYQIEYTDDLSDFAVRSLLREDRPVRGVFMSPTGSGKNIMMAKTAENISNSFIEKGKTVAFMVLSPQQLYKQTHNTFVLYFEENLLINSMSIDSLQNPCIKANQCLCINWERMNKGDKNTINKENETGFSLSVIIDNTKSSVDYLVIFIDEQSIFLNTKRSQQILEQLKPHAQLEFSATVDLNADKKVADCFIDIPLDKVKESGMIKESIIINPNFGRQKIISLSDSELIKLAINHRNMIECKYIAVGSDIKPIYLMQVENAHEDSTQVVDAISDFRANGITIENGKLAIDFANRKENWDIVNNQPKSGVQFIIWKSALTYGWDCPQCQGQIASRSVSNEKFTVQSLGRLNRMPERKHYPDKDLNSAYIFTNREEFAVNLDKVWNSYVKGGDKTSRIRDEFRDINLDLPNSIRRRNRELSRLGGKFPPIFEDPEFIGEIKDGINLNNIKLSVNILCDAKINDIDSLVYENNELEHVLTNDKDFQFYYDSFLKRIMKNGGVGGLKDSLDTLKKCINRLFIKLGYKKYDSRIPKIVLSNREIFESYILNCIERYKKAVADVSYVINTSGKPFKIYQRGNLIDGDAMQYFNLPREIYYGQDQELVTRDKSVMDLLKDCKSPLECEFMSMLETHPNVKCWFKNGESETKFLGIQYKNSKDGQINIFYPDFIVVFNNGTIFIGDTKGGMIADIAADKAEGLHKYIEQTNFGRLQKGLPKIFGGIAAQKSDKRFILCDREIYSSTKDKEDWKDLETEFKNR